MYVFLLQDYNDRKTRRVKETTPDNDSLETNDYKSDLKEEKKIALKSCFLS